MSGWLDNAIRWFSQQFPPDSFLHHQFNVKCLLAVLLVSLVCGAVGALVVGNRMAFFSDALAHCAFAGIALGFLIALASGVRNQTEFRAWTTPIMVVFGILVGLAISWVRERSGLSADTVIGVFFAGAVGFGLILLKFVSHHNYFRPESFLFGNPLLVSSTELVWLLLLALGTGVVLSLMYNRLVLASFNPSLALSRRVSVRFCNTLFVILLALVVNMCLHTVGVLLINAMLIVPAATASNFARNMRQLFWITISLCLFIGIAGQMICWNVTLKGNGGEEISYDVGSVMVVLSVTLFFVTLVLRPWLRRA
jgi:zinc transport system permease protein